MTDKNLWRNKQQQILERELDDLDDFRRSTYWYLSSVNVVFNRMQEDYKELTGHHYNPQKRNI